jgi:glycosyltransferase involved in cell wall biosynthesis
MDHKGRLSIGLPVYNGELFLAQALDSLLSQTFSDFTLIISDNASTDRTAEICKEYQARDRRIQYTCMDKNYGAARNFNHVFESASGEYFKWAAHDDIHEPTFLQQCIDVLDQDSSVVLAYPKTTEIDEQGQPVRSPEIVWDFTNPRPSLRYRSFLRQYHRCFEFFGVIRARSLRTTSLLGNYSGADIVLLAELVLRGPFYQLDDRLFLRRAHPGLYKAGSPARHQRTPWFDTAKEGRIVLPAWTVLFGYWKAIRHAPISRREQWACYMEVVRGVRLRWKPMLEDLVIAARQGVRQVVPRKTGIN